MSSEEIAQARARSRLLNRVSGCVLVLAALLLGLLFFSLNCDIGGGRLADDRDSDPDNGSPRTVFRPPDAANLFFVLRFPPWERDPQVHKPAFARLIRPDGTVLVVDGWRNDRPDWTLFFHKLDSLLAYETTSWRTTHRIIIENPVPADGPSDATQGFRNNIERIVEPRFLDVDWRKTDEIEQLLAEHFRSRDGSDAAPDNGSDTDPD